MTTRRVAVIALVAAASGALAPPAKAASPAEVTFTCTAILEGWSQSGVCGNGTLPAVARVEAGGTDDYGTPFVVDDLGPVQATFSYMSGCIANEPALFGTAEGLLTVSELTGVRSGSTIGATLEVGFLWSRFGTEATMTVTWSRFTFDDGGTATTARGAGVATLIPVRSYTTCPYPESGEALLTGSVALVL